MILIRVWSIQSVEVYEQLKVQNVLHCKPELSELISNWGFRPAYDWLAQQMIVRIGPPPFGVHYPFWAWHTLGWKHQKPDLRCTEFRAYRGNMTCLELEIPDSHVLLSDEEQWHFVLADWFYAACFDEQSFEKAERWFESLTADDQFKVKTKSWERIFEVSPPYDNGWDTRGRYVQATFWELRLDQVIAIRYFKGRRGLD